MKRLNSHKYNVLLVKDDVGRAKHTTRKLPNERHTFGKAETRDPENAGQGKHIFRSQNERSQIIAISSQRGFFVQLS